MQISYRKFLELVNTYRINEDNLRELLREIDVTIYG